jgi:hypothetical protein
MRSSVLSIKTFGAYAILMGLGLAIAPAMLLPIFGLPAPSEIWVRVLGALALVVGYYYWACGAAEAKAFFKASLVGRLLFGTSCILLVLLAGAPLQLILFGAIDAMGAAWTAYALRAEEAM